MGFPDGPVVKNSPCNARDTDSIPVLEDPTCLGATKPEEHHYWNHGDLEPVRHNKRTHLNEKLN